jgi:hypothetical protein
MVDAARRQTAPPQDYLARMKKAVSAHGLVIDPARDAGSQAGEPFT